MLRPVLLAILAAYSFGSAQAASLISSEPVSNWSGLYLGVETSGSVTNGTLQSLDYCLGSGDCVSDFSASQIGLGVVAGGNFEVSNVVLGAEGHLAMTFGSAPSLLQGFDAYQGDWVTSSPWNASLLGRVGIPADDRLLVFATGGIAVANFGLSNGNCTGCAEWGTQNLHAGLRVGAAVGVGAEYALDPRVHARLDYLHSDFGTVTTVSSNSNHYSSRLATDAVKLGLTISMN